MKETDDALRSLYTTCFSQKFSTDSDSLAACDNFGNISLFRLSNVLNADNIDKVKNPYLKFKVSNSSLYTLESSKELLISAPLNKIIGWKWSKLMETENKNNIKSAFELPIRSIDGSSSQNIETNSLVYDSKKGQKRILAACGNGEIYNFDLETSKLINRYQAHEESIYKIVMKNDCDELITASEDGDVKIWDLRQKDCVSTLKPFENQLCSRPHLGKYINSIAVDENNWLICGGGPKLSMWHLRSMKVMSLLENNDDFFIPNTCVIYRNQILSGGNSNSLYVHTFENKLKTTINTNISCIYDISCSNSSNANNITCVSGSSSSIDICSNLSYKATTLNL